MRFNYSAICFLFIVMSHLLSCKSTVWLCKVWATSKFCNKRIFARFGTVTVVAEGSYSPMSYTCFALFECHKELQRSGGTYLPCTLRSQPLFMTWLKPIFKVVIFSAFFSALKESVIVWICEDGIDPSVNYFISSEILIALLCSGFKQNILMDTEVHRLQIVTDMELTRKKMPFAHSQNN